jgi:GT2 family glycosyltransferase
MGEHSSAAYSLAGAAQKYVKRDVLKLMKPGNGKIITISIVIYQSNLPYFFKTLESLQEAVSLALKQKVIEKASVFIIDNGTSENDLSLIQKQTDKIKLSLDVAIMSGHGNIGYGCGHNIAIEAAFGGYHLILNPDAVLDIKVIVKGISYLVHQKDVGLIVPMILDEKNQKSHLCKQYPDLFTLFLRGFSPQWIKRRFQKRLERYEIKTMDLSKVQTDIPIVSGCFMLFKKDILDKLSGFDPRYFLYFEDFDLSLRTGKITKIAMVPDMKIVHFGGHAARKGLKHILLFLWAAVNFFRINGWKLF